MYNFEIYKDRRGEYRWRFIASNGRILADSGEGYVRRSDCEHAIGLIQRYAPTAGVRALAY